MKVAIITGGNRGIGKSAALNVAKQGTGVIITYNSHAEEALAVVNEIKAAGGTAAALKLNVGDTKTFDDFISNLKKTLKADFGRADFNFLVNNAGIAQRTLIKDTTEEQFDQLNNIHFKGPFFLTQKLIPLMEDGGTVINVSTGLSRFTGLSGTATYGAVKGAMEVITRYIVTEYAARKIRANTVAPGAIDTHFAGPNKRDEAQKKAIASHTALGRCGEPEDIGPVIASLLTDELYWINAQRIEVSGGMHI